MWSPWNLMAKHWPHQFKCVISPDTFIQCIYLKAIHSDGIPWRQWKIPLFIQIGFPYTLATVDVSCILNPCPPDQINVSRCIAFAIVLHAIFQFRCLKLNSVVKINGSLATINDWGRWELHRFHYQNANRRCTYKFNFTQIFVYMDGGNSIFCGQCTAHAHINTCTSAPY